MQPGDFFGGKTITNKDDDKLYFEDDENRSKLSIVYLSIIIS